MPITFNAGISTDYAFFQTISVLGDGISATTTLDAQPDFLLLDILGASVRIEGTGLTYAVVFGKTVLTGGTVENVLVHSGSDLIGSFTGLSLPATDYAAAIAAEYLGTNMTALEEQFFQNDFVFQGTNTKDFLLPGRQTDDGFLIEPEGDDIAYLRGGNDRFAMGRGDDIAYGGTGRDKIWGGQGYDTLYGGSGSDTLWGNDGKDVLYGGTSNDSLFGGNSRDLLVGGSGNDDLFGGRNKDTLLGGKGDDKLTGGTNHDILTGGAGADMFIFGRGVREGNDIITDFEVGVDTLIIEIARGFNIEDTVSGALITINGLNTVLLEGVFEADLDPLTDIQFG